RVSFDRTKSRRTRMAKFQTRRVPWSDPGSPEQSPNRAPGPPSPRRSSLRAAGSIERGTGETSNRGWDRGRPPRANPASYVIALSQTDTLEQARWAHAGDAAPRADLAQLDQAVAAAKEGFPACDAVRHRHRDGPGGARGVHPGDHHQRGERRGGKEEQW